MRGGVFTNLAYSRCLGYNIRQHNKIGFKCVTNKQSSRRQLSHIDKFSIGTGIIGLVADAVSLASLFALSSNAQSAPLHVWLIVLLSIVYSIAAINFYACRYFCKQTLQKAQGFNREELKRIEQGTFSATLWAGIPILICYFIFAFIKIDDPYFDYSFMNFVPDELLPIVRGLLYGGTFAWLICYYSHKSVSYIYKAFDPSYQPTSSFNSNRINR